MASKHFENTVLGIILAGLICGLVLITSYILLKAMLGLVNFGNF